MKMTSLFAPGQSGCSANTLEDKFHRDNGFMVDDPGSRSFLFVDTAIATTAMRAKVMEVVYVLFFRCAIMHTRHMLPAYRHI